MKTVSILGATGSVGDSTLDLIARNPSLYAVEALTAHGNAEKLAELAKRFHAKLAVVGDETQFQTLKNLLSGTGIAVAAGKAALCEAASRPTGLVVSAIMGAAGVAPTFAAISAKNTVALANKESLVAAGDLMMAHAKANDVTLLPMDSEHNALAQALTGHRMEDVEALTITASGGPFRTWSAHDIATATVAQALKHPNWSMGAKITIDSASMMNKGLELIEAMHIFALPPQKLHVLVHPQSIIHGLVSYRDGSVLAHLGPHDMRVPIAHCLAYPNRIDGPVKRLNLIELSQLTFEAPDESRFPCLRLAREAMQIGGGLPCVMNAANEVVVAAFLNKAVPFGAIPAIVEAVMSRFAEQGAPQSLEDVEFIDHMAREAARPLVCAF